MADLQRKLTAILSADMAGYSRLMGGTTWSDCAGTSGAWAIERRGRERRDDGTSLPGTRLLAVAAHQDGESLALEPGRFRPGGLGIVE